MAGRALVAASTIESMTTSTTSTVPRDVDALYPLAAEQVSAYRKQGFVRLPHVLSSETVGRYVISSHRKPVFNV
jgi:hypothetical protein